MDKTHVYDMVIVGGGPGGYTAALYAARAGLDTLVLEKLSPGGQMAQTDQIDNYPGFEEGIDGFSLAEKMQKQAERFGAKSEYAEVSRLNLTANPKVLESSEGTFYGKTVVLASGAVPRELGVAKEAELAGRGVTYCRRRRRTASEPYRKKRDPRPPQGYPARHKDIPPAAAGQGECGILLEQHGDRVSAQ